MHLWTKTRIPAVFFLYTLVSLQAAASASDVVDPALEAELDGIIEVGFYPPDRQAFEAILASVDAFSTPVETYIRTKAYHAFQTGLRDGDMPAAMAVLERIAAVAAERGTANARFEVLASESHLLLEQNRLADAMARVPMMQEDIEQVSNPRLRFFGYHVIARIFKQNSQYDEALEYFTRSYDELSNEDTVPNHRRRIFINLNMARLHAELRNDGAALEIAGSTIEFAKTTGLHARLPDLYLVQGFIHGRNEATDDALESYLQAIEWAEELGDQRARLVGRNNAGSVLITLGRFDQARMVLHEGIALSDALGRPRDADIMRFNLGYIDVSEGQHEQGLEAMEAALDDFRQSGRRAELLDWLSYLADAYQMAGRYQRQAQTLVEQRELRDEVFRAERDRVINELHLRFETEEQNRRIELLRQRSELQQEQLENQRLQQRIVVLGVIVGLLAAVLMALLYRAARRANARLNKANLELQEQSSLDPLTGLMNRRSLQEHMARHRRLPGERDALILLDIDFFKRINDRQGHATGDEVLIELAARLRAVCRDTDLVVRWGGEEFLIVLRNTSVEALPEFSRRLLEAVSGLAVENNGKHIDVTATAGLVTLPLQGWPGPDLDWEQALQLADVLLYYGKSHGRNQVNGITAVQAPAEVHIETILQQDINKAINNHWVDRIQVLGRSKNT